MEKIPTGKMTIESISELTDYSYSLTVAVRTLRYVLKLHPDYPEIIQSWNSDNQPDIKDIPVFECAKRMLRRHYIVDKEQILDLKKSIQIRNKLEHTEQYYETDQSLRRAVDCILDVIKRIAYSTPRDSELRGLVAAPEPRKTYQPSANRRLAEQQARRDAERQSEVDKQARIVSQPTSKENLWNKNLPIPEGSSAAAGGYAKCNNCGLIYWPSYIHECSMKQPRPDSEKESEVDKQARIISQPTSKENLWNKNLPIPEGSSAAAGGYAKCNSCGSMYWPSYIHECWSDTETPLPSADQWS